MTRDNTCTSRIIKSSSNGAKGNSLTFTETNIVNTVDTSILRHVNTCSLNLELLLMETEAYSSS